MQVTERKTIAMQSHPEIDLIVARDLQRSARELAARLREARIAREQPALHTSGTGTSTARWMSRALFRTNPGARRRDATS
jgi:hypothetical protein